MYHPRSSTLVSTFPAVVLLVVAMAGCAGYQMGTRSLYRPDVQTVHVPVFTSDSFRRTLGERLTEAVVREIELKTPYKVVGCDRADTVLVGQIVADSKTPLSENRNDEPRDIELAMQVQVEWRNRRGELISQQHAIPVPWSIMHVGQSANLIPEAGQSIATTQQEAIHRLAEQIVTQMEVAW